MEINAGSSTLPIPDDTRLLGQRPSNQGGAPVPFSVSELTDKIMGGGGTTFSREGLTATKTLRAVPPTDGNSEFVGVHPYFEGNVIAAHTNDLWSGIPNRFGSEADHGHYKIRVANPNGPGSGTAGERAQIMYSARTAGDSTINVHGYASEIPTTALASEHSIDTTATSVGAAPSYIGVIKLRHTVNHGLTVNQRVLFRTFAAVAGIQASFFYGLVTQAPTLVSGVYETLVQLTSLDTNHWTPAKAANTSSQNADWVLLTLNAGELNAANKTSLARDLSGPSDQLLITWATAHGLSYGQNVVVWADSSITGLTGIWAGFHSGTVAEVVSSTQARVRIRNMRSMTLRSFTGTVSSATSTWAVFAGTLDPHHEVMQATNAITAQRDSTGRTRRLMLGDTDVLADDEWAVGVGGPGNEVRGRTGDLFFGGGGSVRSMIGGRVPNGGVRVINDSSATFPCNINIASLSNIGAGDFTVALVCTIASTEAVLITVAHNGTLLFTLRSPLASTGAWRIDRNSGADQFTGGMSATAVQGLIGKTAVLVLQRTATTLTLWCNGALVGSVTHSEYGLTLDNTAYLRFGGAFVASQRYHGTLMRAWAFGHLLTSGDISFISETGRLPNALQYAALPGAALYQSDFSAGIDGWTTNGVSLGGNVDSIGSRDDCLRITIDSAVTAPHLFAKSPVLPRGKRARISLDAYRPAGNAVVTALYQGHYNQGTTGIVTQISPDTWTTLTYDVEDQGVSGSTAGLILYMANAAGAITFTGNGTDVLYIRNVRAQRLGAFLDLDFSVGAGLQAPDRSGNALHAALTAPFEHIVPERRFQIFARVSASGNTQITGIPANARIDSLTATAAGTVTLSVGNTSSGTQIVNAQSLSGGTQEITLAGRFSSTGNLWVNLSGAVQADLTFDCVATGA